MSSHSDTPDTPVSLIMLFPDGLRGKRIHAVGAGQQRHLRRTTAGRRAGSARHWLRCGRDDDVEALNAQGVQVTVGHDPAHVAGHDLVVTTPAVTFLDDQHPELVAAREQGIPVIQWQELLGYLMRDSVGVSVAGVHGKGSTTALLGALAIAGGLDPTVEVGAVVSDWDANLCVGAGALLHQRGRRVQLQLPELPSARRHAHRRRVRSSRVLRGLHGDSRRLRALPARDGPKRGWQPPATRAGAQRRQPRLPG